MSTLRYRVSTPDDEARRARQRAWIGSGGARRGTRARRRGRGRTGNVCSITATARKIAACATQQRASCKRNAARNATLRSLCNIAQHATCNAVRCKAVQRTALRRVARRGAAAAQCFASPRPACVHSCRRVRARARAWAVRVWASRGRQACSATITARHTPAASAATGSRSTAGCHASHPASVTKRLNACTKGVPCIDRGGTRNRVRT